MKCARCEILKNVLLSFLLSKAHIRQDRLQKHVRCGTSLVVQWLRCHAAKAGGMGLIPGWGTKIPQAVQHGQKIFFFFLKHVKLFRRTESPLLRRTTTDLTFYCGYLEFSNFWTRDPTFLFYTALEEGMATHSSILAWRIPWTEEPGGLQPMGSQSSRLDWIPWAGMHVCVCVTWWTGSLPLTR